MFAALAERLVSRYRYQKPTEIIGDPAHPYLNRWHLIPHNRWCNIYLHQFLRDDDDRALHDHPWASVTLVLRGGYIDVTREGERWLAPGSIVFRRASATHRIELDRAVWGQPLVAWSLFITGPKCREWGFHTKTGWVHHKLFGAQ